MCAGRTEFYHSICHRILFSVTIIWKAGRLYWVWWSTPIIPTAAIKRIKSFRKLRFHLKRLKKWGGCRGWVWEEGSVETVPVSQAWESEFRFPKHSEEQGTGKRGAQMGNPWTQQQLWESVSLPTWSTSSHTLAVQIGGNHLYFSSHPDSPYKLLKTM